MYYGKYKIKETKVIEGHSTPGGYPIVEVTLEDKRTYGEGKKEKVEVVEFVKILPSVIVETLQTEDPITLEDLRSQHEKIVINKMIENLLEYDIDYSDLASLFQKIIGHLENAQNNAIYKRWYGNDTRWYPGLTDTLGEVGLVEVDLIQKGYERN